MNPVPMAISAVDAASLAPELVLTAGGVVILLLDAFLRTGRRLATPLAAFALVAAAVVVPGAGGESSSFHGFLEATPATWMLAILVLITALISLLAADGFLRRHRLLGGEYHALFLWCTAGILLMSRGRDLLTIFLALELFSVCLYCLAGYTRRVATATEAALKYFLMGAFASAFLLYGIALVYAVTGSLELAALPAALAGAPVIWPVWLGIALLIAGFAFKMSLVPFHAWAPDTYQGAPSPFVAFLSVAPKAAAAVVLLRILEVADLLPAGPDWGRLVAVLAVASMLLGNVLALVQRDIKRMLAYSGIAHMGYLLLALVTVNADSWRAALTYLLAYGLMNAGAFAVVTLLYRRSGEQHLISDLAGWGYRAPWLAACLTVFMLALGGLPPTFGFIAKYVVFVQAIEAGHVGLVLLGVVASLIGVAYYLRVVYTLYMKAPLGAEEENLRLPGADFLGPLACALAAAATLVLGLAPGALLRWLLDLLPGT